MTYHQLCAINRNLKKVSFFRLSSLTRPLPVRVPAVQFAGQEMRSWFDDDDRWLLDTQPRDNLWQNEYATDPMPDGRKRIVTKPLYERDCDCGLAPGNTCCCAG